MKHRELFFLGVLVHLVLLYSIFDVYYKSPVIHGLDAVPIRARAPAKRLVLFVADGLRAQSFLEPNSRTGKTVSPYLKNVMKTRGSWGISHTRVPTESRPGHVALIAGLYEDISAVAKGWKENPVEFDSVFNQSRFTWSWGSPDILPMFAKGASSHVFTNTYPGSSEDFASEDASKLDTWVFDSVKKFFNGAKSNKTLLQMLHQEGIVFFLHLLGIDTNGHGNKPHSKEYIDNIDLVDRGVKQITEMIENFYGNDEKTSFIFTADHGMTDWGSHGAGDHEETMTPLVVWGAGIAGPSKTQSGNREESAILWGLSNFERKDVWQADVAPLMSVLIGVPVPVNSVGTLPVRFLNSKNEKYIYHAACANFHQVLGQFKKLRADKQSHSIRAFFREFSELRPKKLASLELEVSKMGQQRRFSVGTDLCLESIPLLLGGIRYFHQYERKFLTLAIVAVFLSWMCLVMCVGKLSYYWRKMAKDRDRKGAVSWPVYRLNRVSLGIISAISGFLWIQHLPFTFYVYSCLPVLLWNLCWNLITHVPAKHSVRVFGSELLLVTAGGSLIFAAFFHRWAFSVGLSLMSCVPADIYGANYKLPKTWLRCLWVALCLGNAVFPLLPTVGQASHAWVVVVGPFSCAVALLVALIRHKSSRKWQDFDRNWRILALLGMVLATSGVVILLTDFSIASKLGLPTVCQAWSWVALAAGPMLALVSCDYVGWRLLTLFLGLFCPYSLMSVSYEAVFYLVFGGLLTVWLMLEMGYVSGDYRFDNLF